MEKLRYHSSIASKSALAPFSLPHYNFLKIKVHKETPMFRVFLRRKQESDKLSTQTAANDNTLSENVAAENDNRRLFRRYQIEYKHLTIMNDADIFVIRDVSSKGFCVEASQRALERLQIGDTYDARMKYFGEIYDLQTKVCWKRDHFVGFEIVMATTETFLFLQRLIKPVAIGSSLKALDKQPTGPNDPISLWFRGDESTDLLIWIDQESVAISAWRITCGKDCIEWSQQNGFTTGSLKPTITNSPDEEVAEQLIVDQKPSKEKRLFARDVIMAFEHEIKEDLLPTFET